MTSSTNIGIYCLGSDGILDWLIGLLESLKQHAPHLPVFVIPFDDNISQLSALQSTYGFEWYVSDTLPLLERMAQDILGKSKHAAHVFRKFSVFWGPLEHFLFLDADIVVQDTIDTLFMDFAHSRIQFAFADADMDQAYKPGSLREAMRVQHGAQGFNSGCFLSSHGALTLAQIQAAAARAALVRDSFVSQYEQSFFNYLVDTSGISQSRICDFCADCGPQFWAALSPLEQRRGRWFLIEHGAPKHPMPMLHWAGYKCESLMPNADAFLRYRLQAGNWREKAAFRHRFTQRERAKRAAQWKPRAVAGRIYRRIVRRSTRAFS